MYFTKHDDLILFHFNMKKLIMFKFFHIKICEDYFRNYETQLFCLDDKDKLAQLCF